MEKIELTIKALMKVNEIKPLSGETLALEYKSIAKPEKSGPYGRKALQQSVSVQNTARTTSILDSKSGRSPMYESLNTRLSSIENELTVIDDHGAEVSRIEMIDNKVEQLKD